MIEEELRRSLSSGGGEKTYIGQILSKEDIYYIRDLMKKEDLSRSELLEVLYMCLSTESKLVNLGAWDRYIILKYFVWLREFIKIAELVYDYRDNLERDAKKNGYALSERVTRLLQNNMRLIEHNAKFLIDLYLNIMRTSLSLGATGFMELLTNKYEMVYPQQGLSTPAVQEPRGGGLLGMGRKKE